MATDSHPTRADRCLPQDIVDRHRGLIQPARLPSWGRSRRLLPLSAPLFESFMRPAYEKIDAYYCRADGRLRPEQGRHQTLLVAYNRQSRGSGTDDPVARPAVLDA